MSTERVNICLTAELLARIDREASTYGDSRSNFIRRAVISYLDQQQSLRSLPEMARIAGQIMEQSKDLQLTKQMHLADLAEDASVSAKKAPKRRETASRA